MSIKDIKEFELKFLDDLPHNRLRFPGALHVLNNTI